METPTCSPSSKVALDVPKPAPVAQETEPAAYSEDGEARANVPGCGQGWLAWRPMLLEIANEIYKTCRRLQKELESSAFTGLLTPSPNAQL